MARARVWMLFVFVHAVALNTRKYAQKTSHFLQNNADESTYREHGCRCVDVVIILIESDQSVDTIFVDLNATLLQYTAERRLFCLDAYMHSFTVVIQHACMYVYTSTHMQALHLL